MKIYVEKKKENPLAPFEKGGIEERKTFMPLGIQCL